MACIEDMHKGMKSKAHKQKTWSNFAAEVINDEYKRMDAVEKKHIEGITAALQHAPSREDIRLVPSQGEGGMPGGRFKSIPPYFP